MLLLLSVAALFLGVFGAFYLDRSMGTRPTQTAQQPPIQSPDTPAAPANEPPPAPAESSPDKSELASPDMARALDGIQPTAGPETPAPADAAPAPPAAAAPEAMKPGEAPPLPAAGNEVPTSPAPMTPAAGPAPAAPAGEMEAAAASDIFRVVYATYGATHRAYAERLVRSLAGLGIDAAIGEAQGAGRKRLITVWSGAADRISAERAAASARARLPVRPAIRSNAAAARTHRSSTASHPGDVAASLRHFRVQVAAFDRPPAAKRLQRRLAADGIVTVIVRSHRPGGRPVILVRTRELLGGVAARAVATRVQRVIGSRPLAIAVHGHSREPAQATPRNRQ